MKHRTSNIEYPTSETMRSRAQHWMLDIGCWLLGVFFCILSFPAIAAGKAEHVVVIVWDGMRPDFVSREHTPTLWQMARDGVMFTNHHPVYVSSTEVNGAALATGAYPQNSGIIGNREYRPGINPLRAVDTQDAATIRKGDEISHGHYLMRATLAETLQAAGKTTAIAGTKPVAHLHDRRDQSAETNGVIVYEGTTPRASLRSTLTNVLGPFPNPVATASPLPNEPRDEWTTRALTTVLWSNSVPAFSLLWLCEPDYSQHPSAPGSPKALAALGSCDRKLAEVLAELDRRKLRDKTDVFVVSDHGFSTIERTVDVCAVLQKAGFPAQRAFSQRPERGQILVNGVGGSVLFYVIDHEAKVAEKLAEFLQQQDFPGVIFAREKIPGTFPLSDANINSSDAPDVVLSMHWSADKSKFGAPGMLTLDGAGGGVRGSHASLSHFDMHNTLIGAGPDLKRGFVDTFPTGNTDLAPTILWLLDVKPIQPMDGRVLSEALTAKAPKMSKPTTRRIQATRKIGDSIWNQYLQISRVNDTVYFDEGNGTLSHN